MVKGALWLLIGLYGVPWAWKLALAWRDRRGIA